MASHAGLVLEDQTGTMVYDPGSGCKEGHGRGSDGTVTDEAGASRSDYSDYSEKADPTLVITHSYSISQADAEQIRQNIDKVNDDSPLRCAADVSGVINGVGVFKSVGVHNLPST